MKSINEILIFSNAYEQECSQTLEKYAKIRKLPSGKYRVLSEKGKNLGTFDSKCEAEKRLQQIEFFKHKNKFNADDQKVIDLTDIDDFSYSAVMRKMRQEASKEQTLVFMKLFKNYFDKAIQDKLQKPDRVALQKALVKFNKQHPIKIEKKLIKQAAISELGDPALVGKYLADIVRFTLNRINPAHKAKTIDNLKRKFYAFNAEEIANKKMPPTSSIGQSITFVKHVLLNQNANYIREVLNNLVRNL